jgi:WD40 repeat protein
VFFVDPTPDGGDLVSDRPGWAIWRWDRLDESVRRVVGCGEVDCQLRKPVPSPDGRYLAYAQGDGIVVVDAGNGQEVYRLPDLVADGWSLPFANVAWDADGRLLVLDLDIDGFSYRTVDVSTGTGAEFTLPRDGLLESSPDGATTLLMTGEPDVWRLLILDDQLEHTRVLWEGAPWVSGVTWSPDGTTIAGQTMAEVPPPRSVAYDLQIVDIATGTLTTHADDDAVAGQPLWLPAE